MKSKKFLKKGGLLVATAAVVIAGAAAFSAFESHIINVTARIENALSVTEGPLEFGTVFPQEYLTDDIQISLSQSFLDEDRVDDVTYVIKQKPKVKDPVASCEGQTGVCDPNLEPVPGNPYATLDLEEFDGPAWQYCEENLPPDADPEDGIGYSVDLTDEYWTFCYLPLANSLSKHKVVDESEVHSTDSPNIDIDVAAFHQAYQWDDGVSSLVEENIASGKLMKSEDDIEDTWVIDLKVPCFYQMCAQEAFDPENDIDDEIPGFHVPTEFQLDPVTEHAVFGTDLWIEVNGISLPPDGGDEDGTLTVTKLIVNDDGGTLEDPSAFSFTVDGGSAVAFEGDGSNDVVVSAGAHTVVEPAVDGYTATFGGDCTAAGVVNVPASGTATCTITNDDNDIPPGTLTVTKIVTNDDAGTSVVTDFSFMVDGGAATAFEADGSNDVSVAAGPHVVTEPAVAGYDPGTFSGDCDASGNVVVPSGGTATCTITNNDSEPVTGSITVTKVVTNNNGGTAVVTDFDLFVGNTEVTSGVSNDFSPGNYAISEAGLFGYSASFSGDCDLAGNLTLAAGADLTCTITNDDIPPSITLVKSVVGGTAQPDDFDLSINHVVKTSGSSNQVVANAAHIIDEEVLVAGYTFTSITGTSFKGVPCPLVLEGTITLAPGDVVTCTITNTFTP
jgi:hypothetical protein